MHGDDLLTMAQVCTRSGTTAVTLRFYERKGLIAAVRTAGNQRRYQRHMLRRLAVISAGQRVGMTLEEIKQALIDVPMDRSPTKEQWQHISTRWEAELDARLAMLQHLRQDLGSCTGCGCLSLEKCPLYNPDDALAAEGPGARIWLRNSVG